MFPEVDPDPAKKKLKKMKFFDFSSDPESDPDPLFPDPDPHENEADPKHWLVEIFASVLAHNKMNESTALMLFVKEAAIFFFLMAGPKRGGLKVRSLSKNKIIFFDNLSIEVCREYFIWVATIFSTK